jgi:hypothetical protein
MTNNNELKNNYVKNLFIVFLISVAVHKFNYLNTQLFGINIQNTLGVSLLVFPLIFLILTYYQGIKINRNFKFENSIFVNFIILYVLILFIFGVISGNYFQRAIEELWTACVIYFSYKLSTNAVVWNLFNKKINYLYIIFAFFVYLGIGYTQEILDTGQENNIFEGITTSTEAYNISPILDLWPLLLFFGMYKESKGYKKVLAYLPFFIYIGFQVFFLKRAPTIRALMHFTRGSFLIVLINGASSKGISSLFLLISFIVFSYFLIPNDLSERFKTEDNSRQEEFLGMINQLSGQELIFGKGLGSEYKVSNYGVTERINENNIEVKSSLHIGIGDSILKGGVILFSIILFHFLYVMNLVLKNYKNLNIEEFASFCFLSVFVLFRLIEGGITPGTIFSAFCFGISLGTLEQIPKRLNFERTKYN